MAQLIHSQWDEEFILYPHFGAYENGSLAIQLYDVVGEPFATITTNLNISLKPGEVFIKNWSENEAIAKALLKAGWLEDTGKSVPSGHVQVPIMRLAGDLRATYEELMQTNE